MLNKFESKFIRLSLNPKVDNCLEKIALVGTETIPCAVFCVVGNVLVSYFNAIFDADIATDCGQGITLGHNFRDDRVQHDVHGGACCADVGTCGDIDVLLEIGGESGVDGVAKCRRFVVASGNALGVGGDDDGGGYVVFR